MESTENQTVQNEVNTPVTKEVKKEFINIRPLLKESWGFVKKHANIVAWYVGVLTLISALTSDVTIDLVSNTAFAPLLAIGVFVTTIFVIINSWAMMHVVSQEPDVVLNYKISFDWAAKNFFPLIWTSVAAFFAILFGYILLVIPGVILSVYLYFAIYANVIDGEVGIKALKQSYRVVKGHWWNTAWKLVVLGFYMFVLYIPVALLMGIIIGLLEVFGESTYGIFGAEIILLGISGGVFGVMSMYVLARFYKVLKNLA